MNTARIYRILLISVCLTSHLTHSYDAAHFYRATPFFPEPRLGRDWLSSIDCTLSGGSTRHGLNSCSEKVPLLDIYGVSNMQQLGVNVPNKSLTNPLDLILIQLSLIPACGTFGMLSIDGQFKDLEATFSWTQNFIHGFFMQVHAPFRRLCINDICITDLTPTDDCCPNVNNPIWQAFLANFDAILERYCLSKEPVCTHGIGDVTIYAGWTYNYQDTTILDFVDTTLRLGVITPTSKFQNQNLVFALPIGYNKSWGVPLAAQVAFGAYEWVTFGGHIEAIVFANTTHDMRMKTALHQQGMFKLAQGKAVIERGSIWQAGAYTKADHFARGLSFLFGYSFTQENKTTLIPCNQTIFNQTIVNSDEALQGWKMHTLHLLAEYDFTTQESHAGCRLGLFADFVIGGKRVFLTNMYGGSLGIDILWNF